MYSKLPNNDFSLVTQITPTLKGVIKDCPLGNLRVVITMNDNPEKSLFGSRYIKVIRL